MARYEVKREAADPFDLMCSDCEVHYIEYFEEISEEELWEEHSYMVAEDGWIPDRQKQIMAEEFGWEPTNPNFDEWLEQCIAEGYVKEVA